MYLSYKYLKINMIINIIGVSFIECCFTSASFYFRISASAIYVNEKDRLNQEELDIKCLQLLRALIHNQIIQLPLDWEYNVKKNNK